MIQESPRNEFRQIVDKLDGTYYPEPMNFDESVPDEAFADAQRGFIEGPCPATVHKNLWRMEKLNNYRDVL